jgi:S-adenosylmethionine-diacylgycerolhomoserine-N-methlytransferase
MSAAAAMDRMYRHQRFVYDLTRRHYLLGRDRLIADLAPGRGTVLEVGCGTGRNLVAAARRHPDARLCGFDVSGAMLETAGAALARAGLAARVEIAQADATRVDAGALFGQPGFDRVFVSYVLSMIPDWRAALERAAAALAPGGRLLVVDFGRQDGLPRAFARGLFAWLALFHVHPIGDLPDALGGLAARHGLTLDCRSLYRGYAVYAVLERPASGGVLRNTAQVAPL